MCRHTIDHFGTRTLEAIAAARRKAVEFYFDHPSGTVYKSKRGSLSFLLLGALEFFATAFCPRRQGPTSTQWLCLRLNFRRGLDDAPQNTTTDRRAGIVAPARWSVDNETLPPKSSSGETDPMRFRIRLRRHAGDHDHRPGETGSRSHSRKLVSTSGLSLRDVTSSMEEIIGFDELRWLQILNSTARKQQVPETIGARLLRRGLIERKVDSWSLTARGRIALAKLA